MMMKLVPVLLLAVACQGTEPPMEVLPRILKGDCVRVALQTRAGDGNNELVIDSLRAQTTGGAGCGRLARIEIAGFVDANRNDRVDPGEGLEPTTWFPPAGATDEMVLEGISLTIPEGKLEDLKLELSVYFTSGRTTRIEVVER